MALGSRTTGTDGDEDDSLESDDDEELDECSASS